MLLISIATLGVALDFGGDLTEAWFYPWVYPEEKLTEKPFLKLFFDGPIVPSLPYGDVMEGASFSRLEVNLAEKRKPP